MATSGQDLPGNKFVVITTINGKTRAIEAFERKKGWHIVVVGDRKSRPIASVGNLTFLSVEDQRKLNYPFARRCPFDHYARKNIGYLYALQRGAEVIYDTDDDNLPYENWALPAFSCRNAAASPGKYVNIYRCFTDEQIWPRGFPLDEILSHGANHISIRKTETSAIGVWQGLTDDDPDIDAIYRLVVGKKIKFEQKEPVYLERGGFCPINSQNTFWNKSAFPFLYLPATVSFRFTDILRGYVAQRLMWQQNLHVGFTGATVYQQRNPHDIMKDFRDEVVFYLHIKGIVEILENLDVGDDPVENMQRVYQELCRASLVSPDEIKYLNLWIENYLSVTSCGA
jgi:hypothetical protein